MTTKTKTEHVSVQTHDGNGIICGRLLATERIMRGVTEHIILTHDGIQYRLREIQPFLGNSHVRVHSIIF